MSRSYHNRSRWKDSYIAEWKRYRADVLTGIKRSRIRSKRRRFSRESERFWQTLVMPTIRYFKPKITAEPCFVPTVGGFFFNG